MKNIAIISFVLFLFGSIGIMDYYDKKKHEEEYCKNVELGIWPDYARMYDKMCVNKKGL